MCVLGSRTLNEYDDDDDDCMFTCFVWSVIGGFTRDVVAFSGKLKSNADYHCRRCLEGENGLFQSVLLKEVVIEPNVKLECVPKFCYLGDTLALGAGGGVEEAARARVRCAWAKFKELSPILMARGGLIPHKGKDIQGLFTESIDIWD